MKSIEQDTILIPYIIAEHAFYDAIEKLKITGDMEWEHKMLKECVPYLCEKADRHFNYGGFFHKKVSGSYGRDYLFSFMSHWSQSWLGKKLKERSLVK